MNGSQANLLISAFLVVFAGIVWLAQRFLPNTSIGRWPFAAPWVILGLALLEFLSRFLWF